MGLSNVITDIAPLYERPSVESVRTDEVLYGMTVQIIQESETGWCYLRTEHGTEGYTPLACLERNADVAAAWRKYPKVTVLAPYIDVQKKPATAAPRVASLTRGGILVQLGTAGEGFVKVGLANGGVGYTRSSYLGEVIADWKTLSEADMRWNLVETALSYNGAAYRTGGRSPLGIDGAGLVAMTYLLNGVSVPREVFLKPGGALGSVKRDALDEGDVLFFRESAGVYMGDGKFVHATDRAGEEGVTVNSLRPKDGDYREDLAAHIVAIGSLF
ncbi:C40 family peptidase [Ruminococcaceae bacterium OttesenSCG-928-I18]|nr:C40 family peptidase [Ruminococcaceae bacterium OttesenSCG-928-I18]